MQSVFPAEQQLHMMGTSPEQNTTQTHPRGTKNSQIIKTSLLTEIAPGCIYPYNKSSDVFAPGCAAHVIAVITTRYDAFVLMIIQK